METTDRRCRGHVAVLAITLAALLSPSPLSAATVDRGLWLTQAEVDALPTSGSAYLTVKRTADGSLGSANVNDQNSNHDVRTLAVALMCAKHQGKYCEKARAALRAAIGTEGSDNLGTARNVVSYVIAADLIGFRDDAFARWVSQIRTRPYAARHGADDLLETALEVPNNHGTHARASAVAAALYLGDVGQVAQLAGRFHDWLGRSGRGWYWNETAIGDTWQPAQYLRLALNPAGSRIAGNDVDGVLREEARRAGVYSWPPPYTGYYWEAMQGVVVTAELLHRAGYPAWSWQNRAVARAARWLSDVAKYEATGDDSWQVHLLQARIGAGGSRVTPARPGKNMGWTDWTHTGVRFVASSPRTGNASRGAAPSDVGWARRHRALAARLA